MLGVEPMINETMKRCVIILLAVLGQCTTNPCAAAGGDVGPKAPARRSKNKPASWVFESKESRTGDPPQLVVSTSQKRTTMLAARDTTLISYLADRAWGHYPRLAVAVNDSYRILLYFDLSQLGKATDIAEAYILLDMNLSGIPPFEDFGVAVHAVTTRWDEKDCCWSNQPGFVESPLAVATLSPKEGKVRLEATQIVRNWIAGTTANHGILLKAAAPLGRKQSTEEESPEQRGRKQFTDEEFSELRSGKRVAIVLVKDFLSVKNTGRDVRDVEFQRYFPAIDDEQIVFARWANAWDDSGNRIPISVRRVEPDELGNLIHTYSLGRFPRRSAIRVVLTSLVARREHQVPDRAYLIPKPGEYPLEVRPFLSSTRMIVCDHRDIEREAQKLLRKTQDAYQLAAELASIMKAKSYKQKPHSERGLPTSVSVLRYGGSCCKSAVCAAAILRACGIPARITYCPAGYLHGITRFYLAGRGWIRMDSTCGVGKLPLVREEGDLGLIRLFDMPVEMERIWYAYAWPYHHNDAKGEYRFVSDNVHCPDIDFSNARNVNEPFFHYEPGSWNRILGAELVADRWLEWDMLAQASRKAVMEMKMGVFSALTAMLPELSQYVEASHDFQLGTAPPNDEKKAMPARPTQPNQHVEADQ
jgi:hypothetical protein